MMKKISTFLLFLFMITALQAQVDPTIFDKFESKFLTIDGYKINVEVKGTGDPIFFIPGGPGNSHDYMQGAFGQYYKTNTVVFFDFLGRGKSDDAKNKSEYSVENDTDLIEKIRQQYIPNHLFVEESQRTFGKFYRFAFSSIANLVNHNIFYSNL